MPGKSEGLVWDRAAAALPAPFFERAPACGLVLGSGWSQTLDEETTLARAAYRDIPGLGASTVPGHAGELRLLEIGGRRVAAFCGRRHWYEGQGWGPVVVPLELLRRMGATRLLLTNAAGGVNPRLRPGDLLLIRDHINTAGFNPLQGPLRPGWGARFPDQSRVYTPALAGRLLALARQAGVELVEGIYAFTAGPAFETPAEIRAYGIWGVDAVGMSTVPEAMVAGAMGMEVAAVSCIANMAAGIAAAPLAHADVLAAAAVAAPRMRRLLRAILEDWTG